MGLSCRRVLSLFEFAEAAYRFSANAQPSSEFMDSPYPLDLVSSLPEQGRRPFRLRNHWADRAEVAAPHAIRGNSKRLRMHRPPARISSPSQQRLIYLSVFEVRKGVVNMVARGGWELLRTCRMSKRQDSIGTCSNLPQPATPRQITG